MEDNKSDSRIMLVNRATGLKRVPIARPVRKGKTAKDKAKRVRAS